MSSGGSGAVFFLGSRAHYQVLQQPETRSYDLENGNASTETIYQNPSVQELWPEGQEPNSNYLNERNWNCYDNDVNMSDEKEKLEVNNGVKKRTKRRQSETTLCDRDADMKPALLNNVSDSLSAKPKARRRISVLAFLASLARRRRRLEAEQAQQLRHLQSALAACSYRESCRCLDCQSRYFECDESEGYSSDESDYSPQYIPQQPEAISIQQYDDEDEDDEVFVDTVPGDNTSTDMLLEAKEPPRTHVSASASASSCAEEDADMQLEVAAGTPVLLNYLLTHPVTCVIQ